MDSGDLNIRKMKNVDIPLFEEWLNKEHIRKWFGDPSEWLNEIYNREGQYHWINYYIVEYEDRSIGFCQYYDCGKTDEGYAWDNEPEGTFGIDYLIGNEHFLGKGMGNQIVKKLTQITNVFCYRFSNKLYKKAVQNKPYTLTPDFVLVLFFLYKEKNKKGFDSVETTIKVNQLSKS